MTLITKEDRAKEAASMVREMMSYLKVEQEVLREVGMNNLAEHYDKHLSALDLIHYLIGTDGIYVMSSPVAN